MKYYEPDLGKNHILVVWQDLSSGERRSYAIPYVGHGFNFELHTLIKACHDVIIGSSPQDKVALQLGHLFGEVRYSNAIEDEFGSLSNWRVDDSTPIEINFDCVVFTGTYQ